MEEKSEPEGICMDSIEERGLLSKCLEVDSYSNPCRSSTS